MVLLRSQGFNQGNTPGESLSAIHPARHQTALLDVLQKRLVLLSSHRTSFEIVLSCFLVVICYLPSFIFAFVSFFVTIRRKKNCISFTFYPIEFSLLRLSSNYVNNTNLFFFLSFAYLVQIKDMLYFIGFVSPLNRSPLLSN